jgi:uncharacterized membrane protein
MRAGRASMVPPSRLTVFEMATALSASTLLLLLLWSYASLPWLLPVHFNRRGQPDGWQYTTVRCSCRS